MAHAGKILLKIVTRHLRDYCNHAGILPERQSDFRPNLSTTDIMLMIRRLQELERFPLYAYFIVLTKAYDSVDRNFLWKIFPRPSVTHQIISVIR